MNNIDPATMQRMQQLIQQNPRLAMLLQKPGLMQKLQAIAQNPNDPMIAQQYASDPDVQELIQIMGPTMGMNQNMPSGPGMSPQMGSTWNQMQSQHATNDVLTHINSEEQFNDIITKAPSHKLVVCDFFAVWCGPCKAIAPQFERLAKLYHKNAIFIKVDVDRNRILAQNKKIAAMPTFHFYKNGIKVDEMRGASVSKLEELILKHMSYEEQREATGAQSPSPYSTFPLHEANRPVYPKARFDKMKPKLLALNNQFISEEGDSVDVKKKHSMNDTEWNLLTQMMKMLQDKVSYAGQTFNAPHYQLLNKLLLWPSQALPPVLDLIRVLSLHPSFAEYCSKHFNFIIKIIRCGGNGLQSAVNGMLVCRIIINLFNRRITAMVLEQHYTQIVDSLFNNMLVTQRKHTRLAFVRVLLHYSYCFYVQNKKYRAQKIRCFALFSEILYREQDAEIILNILMGCGTLLFRDRNVIQFANTLEVEMVFKSYEQKYKDNKHISNCCAELIQAIQKPEL